MESWSFKTLFFPDEPASSPAALGLSELFVSPNTSSSLSLVDDESGNSGSRVSSSLMEFKTHDSSLIALKLGSRNAADRCRLRETTQVSTSSSPPLKRARVRGGLCRQTTPFCQALGCNMDLSGSKDYHKKHKVCDFHSKSPKVIVDGIEQRFCQQCSRFHLLGEFDDSKRSCRRRLAGHNERRRKPQFDALSDKPFRFSQPYQGNRFVGASSQNRTPFVFSDILPGMVFPRESCERVVNPFGQIKFEDKPIYATAFNSSGTEEYYFDSSAGMFHRPLEASNASRALSLLSSQSQDLSGHSAVTARHYCANGFYSSGTDLLEPAMFPEANYHVVTAADFEMVSDRALQQGSSYLQHKYFEQGSTVDLIQLSTHLQRVEHQRSSVRVKQENDEFCRFQTA